MNADDTAVTGTAATAMAAIELCKRNDERDARRYRWLRLNPTFFGWDADYRPDEIDRAVDGEMAE